MFTQMTRTLLNMKWWQEFNAQHQMDISGGTQNEPWLARILEVLELNCRLNGLTN